MTPYDYGVLAFYFAFMLAISWVFRRFVSNVSDYFRSGGQALWWIVGGSAFMVQFSAWTFTGAGSMAYEVGWPILAIYAGNVFGFLLNAFFFAPGMRQLRVITGMDAIRLRFGRDNEQFFTWLQIPFGVLQAGVWLYALAVFFSAVFGLDLALTIVVTGLVVLAIAVLGGSWAVLASDFVQVLVLMPVCLTVTVLALAKVGGVGAFITNVPAQHLDFSELFSDKLLLLWCLAMVLKQLHTTNNLADANRYLCVKDGRQARKAGLLGAGLFAIGCVVWFVPPIAAAIRFPHLAGMFPTLQNPAEGAFIAMARDVMPVGMMGLLVSGIFAATMSSMDSGLNRNSGFFVKNFYAPIVRPSATDRQLLRTGKVVTAVLGAFVIVVALTMSELRDLTLFLWMQRIAILIGVPIIVPLFLGMLVRRTPPWSAWSTVVVGFITSLFITSRLSPGWATAHFHFHAGAGVAAEYWSEGIEMLGNFAVCTAWFLGTKCFWSSASPEYRAQVDTFFQRMRTPVAPGGEEGAQRNSDSRQQSAIGGLCLAYGIFLALLALIPNPVSGRCAFLGCAAPVIAVGGALVAAGRRSRRAAAAAAETPYRPEPIGIPRLRSKP
ncbi:MAG TPA: hypothetical protein VHE61_04760 [Opitutaceae bacterium]|nr:hypothetical protein [Opitutaceae bacterium]